MVKYFFGMLVGSVVTPIGSIAIIRLPMPESVMTNANTAVTALTLLGGQPRSTLSGRK